MRSSVWLMGALGIIGLSPTCADVTGGPPDPAEIELIVRPATMERGDTVQLTLRNGTDAAIGYNLCFIRFERRVADGWVAVPWESLRVCTAILNILAAEWEAGAPLALDASFTPGVYRVTTEVEWPVGGRRLPLASHAFEVLP